MKLWEKLSLVTMAVLLITTGISGAMVIYRSAVYNQEKTVENYEQQVKAAAYSLGRELANSDLDAYSEVARNSYLNFLIKRFDASKYILVEKGQVVCNLTAYDLVDSKPERWNQPEGYSMIQRIEDQYVLITGKAVSAGEYSDFSIVLVQDISSLYEDIRSQVFFCFLVYVGAALMAAALIFLLTKRILKPLRELQQAAGDISAGWLKRRADVHTKDEIGDMAKSFNGMADRIEDQMMELSLVSEQRRQMLGSLTHELKTPMTSIIGYSDTLLHVNLKKEQKESALKHIHEECRRLERLSSKLMSLMGLYENDSIIMEEISMKELFEQVAELEYYHLMQKNITLKCSCSMGNKRVDRDLFESLLLNLIDNGIKASSEGAVIFLEGEGNRITVTDQGVGIPKEEIGRVREAFYMVDKARSRKAGGCGLGLALCDRIAQLHGASLFIESEQGKGTSVSVLFENEQVK